MALLAWPLIVWRGSTNYTWDEQNYYVPAIQRIRTHWPQVDLSGDSLSATAPGFAHFLAGVSLLTGDSLLALRSITFAVSAGVLVTCWWYRPKGASMSLVFWSLAPLACSNFFIKSSAHVVTDNPALLCVVFALAGLFFAPPSWGAIGGLASAAATWVRQSSFWLAGPLVVRALAARGWSAKFAGLLAIIPSVLVLAVLWHAWGGLVPPSWREANMAKGTDAPAAIAYLLAVFGILGLPFAIAARPMAHWKSELGWPGLAGGIIGLSMALAGPNAPDYTAGHWGGYLWLVAAHLPAWHERSLLLLVLAPLGGAVIGAMVHHLRRSHQSGAALTWLSAIAAFAAASAFNREVFQRYFEPPALVLLAFWLFLSVGSASANRTDVRPLIALTTVQLMITLVTAHGRTFGLL
ncbi:MAG TPA: hypothetical protein VGM73_16350 [Candidatus Didemnitutus sp.]